MKKNWYFDADNNFVRIQEFFAFNNIKYHVLDLWDTDRDLVLFPANIINKKDVVYCTSISRFREFFKEEISQQSIYNYLQSGHKLVLYQDIDLLASMLVKKDWFNQLDNSIPVKNSIFFLSDAKLKDKNHVFYNFNSMVYDEQLCTNPWFFGSWINPRLSIDTCEIKNNCYYDFLCVGTLFKNRPHKEILFSELHKNQTVASKTLYSIDKNLQKKFVGRGKYPDVDLTNQCYFDLVPEMLCDDGYYFTEKILRPLLTKTPFLVFSNSGYLDALKTHGFRTFGKVIDESYDHETDNEKRAKKIILEAERISKIGANKIYKELLPEIEHNFKNCQLLSGTNLYTSDKLVHKILKDYNLL